MRLKSIRMVGFKSFADETLIELPNAMTSIVGPNGCGKSNILDALRWVLGEKSAKGLRGQQMEDLIFLGSATRKPAGMAEVEICFENKNRKLHIDLDEVTIGRRIYVSSVSEYYLNGKRTTRKEIERICMDTGIGKSAYSVIEQGKISEILRSTPESRRILLDEAAGIARFKFERQETHQRLKESEENLQRLNDIWKTKQKEIEKLKQQAEKTRQYLKFKDELDKHDKNLRYFRISRLQKKLETGKEQLKAIMEKREKIRSQSQGLEKQRSVMDTENRQQVDELHALDRKHHQGLAAVTSLENRRRHINQECQQRQASMKDLKKRLESEEKKHISLQEKVAQTQQLRLELDTDLNKLQTQSHEIVKEIEKLQNEIKQSITQAERNAEELQKKEKQHAKLLEKLKDVAQKLITELEKKKVELQHREVRRNQLKESIAIKLKETKNLVQTAKTHLQKNNTTEALDMLNSIDAEALYTDFENYDTIAQELRALLFDPSGLLAHKEALDEEMQLTTQSIEALKSETQNLQVRRKELRKQQEGKQEQIQSIRLQIRDCEVRKESQSANHKNASHLLEEARERLNYFKSELAAQEKRLTELEQEKEKIEIEQNQLKNHAEQEAQRLKSLRPEIEAYNKKIKDLLAQIEQTRALMENMLPQISVQERNNEQLRVQLQQASEQLYNDFQINFATLEQQSQSLQLDEKQEEANFQKLQAKIQSLSTFNALAIEELAESEKNMKILEEQRDDIIEARKNILNALSDIDKKSHAIFSEIFEQVAKNFTNIFQKLFNGGTAVLRLNTPTDLLNSGVDIMVQPPGKKNSSIALLSGGEQSMTAIALIFAIYLVRPSPFCFLDEIDAPLDDANIQRFLKNAYRIYGSVTISNHHP